MTKPGKKLHHGVSDEHFAPGAHICQIYNEDSEQLELMLEYLESGLRLGAKSACFSDKYSEPQLLRMLEQRASDRPLEMKTGALTVSGTTPVYFEGNRFEPERMLGNLKAFHQASQEQQFEGARVIGEMVPEVHTTPGGDRLMEYESRVSLLMRTCPVTAVCQYDARRFDGATIMQVLKVHPLMIIRGAVVHNPYFISPEQYLSQTSMG